MPQERYGEGSPRAGYQGHGGEHPADQHPQDRHLPGDHPGQAPGCQGGQGSEGTGGGHWSTGCRFSDSLSSTAQTLKEAITAVDQFKCKLEEEFKNNQVQVSQRQSSW